MKKINVMLTAAACLLATSCGTIGAGTGTTGTTTGTTAGDILSGVIGAATNGETLGNILASVIGADKLTQESLYGTWKYDGPGCAFTSDNALAKAGGEVVATQIEQKLQVQYSKLGFSRSNTYITFSKDGTFTGKVDSKSLSGNYTYNASTGALKLQGLLLSINGYATRNGSGISLLFESKKLISLLQTLSAISGNTTLSTISDISKNYDGVRLGFDLAK